MKLDLRRRGSVLMEFLMVCPILLMLVSMLLQFSQIWIAREVTAYAAYCAARAALVAPIGDEATVCRRAAQTACAWMCLAGLPGGGSSDEDVETLTVVDYDKLTQTTAGVPHDEINDEVRLDNGSMGAQEVLVAGLGTIPGSDSIDFRIGPDDVIIRRESDCVVAYVKFRFPLLMPLAGRVIASAMPESAPDESGFPAIVLTEVCVLPQPYSKEGFPNFVFPMDLPRGGGA